MKETRELTKMQNFILSTMQDNPCMEFSPSYLGSKWYLHKNGRMPPCSSRRNFGTTSAAYKSCRQLEKLGFLEKRIKKINPSVIHFIIKNQTV